MYRTQSPDTDPRAEKILCELAARMTTAEKMAAMERMWLLQKQLAISGLRIRYPAAGTEEMRKRLDLNYLRLWAKNLGLGNELQRALDEAGMG